MPLIPVQRCLVTVFKRIHLYYKLFLYGKFPKSDAILGVIVLAVIKVF